MPNLTKPADTTLPTHLQQMLTKIDPLLAQHGLSGHRAKVALVLDYSGSMRNLYNSGQIQTLVDRFAALAHRFDDNGRIDLFAYHGTAQYIGEFVANEFHDPNTAWLDAVDKMMGGYGGTNYAAGICAFRQEAFGTTAPRTTALKGAGLPWYIGFITDGADAGSTRACMEQFRSLSYEGAFVQCIALGADWDPNDPGVHQPGLIGRLFGQQTTVAEPPEEFAYLARLDTNVPNRLVDNCNFFATVSPTALTDEEFFGRMMGEYPEWLKQAKTQGLIG